MPVTALQTFCNVHSTTVFNRAALLKAACNWLQIPVDRWAEIGVFRGELSIALVRAFPKAEPHLVDPWTVVTPIYRQQAILPEDAYAEVKRVFPAKAVHRLTSEEAAKLFPDEHFNLVYIDALHDRAHVTQDITLWLPKVTAGGLLAGHDWNWPGVRESVMNLLPDYSIHGVNWMHWKLP